MQTNNKDFVKDLNKKIMNSNFNIVLELSAFVDIQEKLIKINQDRVYSFIEIEDQIKELKNQIINIKNMIEFTKCKIAELGIKINAKNKKLLGTLDINLIDNIKNKFNLNQYVEDCKNDTGKKMSVPPAGHT